MQQCESTEYYIWIAFFTAVVIIFWLHKKMRQAEIEFQREVLQRER